MLPRAHQVWAHREAAGDGKSRLTVAKAKLGELCSAKINCVWKPGSVGEATGLGWMGGSRGAGLSPAWGKLSPGSRVLPSVSVLSHH